MLTTNLSSSTTIFVGNHYEVTDGVVTKYYFAGGQRIAMRTGSTLNYLLSDHLGSTSLTTNSSGQVIAEMRYKAWGEERYSSGTKQTSYGYTGQDSYESDFGLLFYNARFYDPQLGRFASADTIVPGGVQGLDRYAYVGNSPINFVDPSGHEQGSYCDRGYCDGKKVKLPEIVEPGEDCNTDCYDAYLMFKAIVGKLGYVPSMWEILHMTMGAEYYSLTGMAGNVSITGAEAVSRNLHYQCGPDGSCTGDELYKFLAAYQPWFGTSGEIDGASTGRMDLLLNSLNNDFSNTGNNINKDIGLILNPKDPRWKGGLDYGRPWNWYGFFPLDPKSAPHATFGYGDNNTAILQVGLSNGDVFWMFTYNQDQNFKHNQDYWEK